MLNHVITYISAEQVSAKLRATQPTMICRRWLQFWRSAGLEK